MLVRERKRIARRDMAKKKKAAKAGAGAVAAGKAARSNVYVQRLAEDKELRENLRDAFQSTKKAYTRMANGKGPAKALMDDKKVQKELKEAASSLREAADQLRGTKRKRRRKRLGKLLLVAIVGAGVAMLASEDVRKKVLDALFGAEEEFEYTSTTSPEAASEPAKSSAGAS
jgi:adenylosuccinate synthase